ncbi:hypothetical protein GCM10017688_41030 [Streptomyces ramulosus]
MAVPGHVTSRATPVIIAAVRTCQWSRILRPPGRRSPASFRSVLGVDEGHDGERSPMGARAVRVCAGAGGALVLMGPAGAAVGGTDAAEVAAVGKPKACRSS